MPLSLFLGLNSVQGKYPPKPLLKMSVIWTEAQDAKWAEEKLAAASSAALAIPTSPTPQSHHGAGRGLCCELVHREGPHLELLWLA